MYCPIGITTHHDKVHIADQSNHHVSVYRTSGEYCFSFGSNDYIPSMVKLSCIISYMLCKF